MIEDLTDPDDPFFEDLLRLKIEDKEGKVIGFINNSIEQSLSRKADSCSAEQKSV
jgi:hypothetical protein